MRDFLRGIFLDDEGCPSCMRLLAFVVVVVVLGVWGFSILRAGAYVPMGYAEAGLVGAAIGGKAWQAVSEYGNSTAKDGKA